MSSESPDELTRCRNDADAGRPPEECQTRDDRHKKRPSI